MTNLLKRMLLDDYVEIIKKKMVEQHHNNISLARRTGYTAAHIGNIMKGEGSDDALGAVVQVLGMEIDDVLKAKYRDDNRVEA